MKRSYDRTAPFSTSEHLSYPSLQTDHGRNTLPGLLPSPTLTQNSVARSSNSNDHSIERTQMVSYERPLSPPNSQQQASSAGALPVPVIEVTQPGSPGLGAVNATTVEDDAGVFRLSPPALLDKVLGLRSDVVAKLVEFRNESRDLCDQHVHFQSAMNRFHDGVKTAFAELNSQGRHEELRRLQGLWDEVNQTSSSLNERAEQIQHTSKDLNNSEERLRRNEATLYRTISQAQSHQPLDEAGKQEIIGFESSLSSSDHPDSEATQPSVVREYYDKVAHADSLREDFLRFRTNNFYQRRRRDGLRSRQQPVHPSESVFLEKYFRERDARIEEFGAALAAAHHLRDECRRNGHEVNDVEIPPLGEEETFDASLLIPQAIVQRSISGIQTSGKRSSKSQNDVDTLLVDVDPKRRVAQWLADVPQAERVEYSGTPTELRAAYLQDHSVDDPRPTSNNLCLPKTKRERSVSQPAPSSSTLAGMAAKSTPLRLTTDFPFDQDQTRPKSAPIILYVQELRGFFP